MGKKSPTKTPGEGEAILSEAKKKSKSRAEKAGLTFPVSKVNKHLRDSHMSKRVGGGAPVYLAAVLEYFAAELIECAGTQLEGNKRKRISPQDVMRAVRNDQDLNKLVGGYSVFVGDRVQNVTSAVTLKAPETTQAQVNTDERE